MAAEQSPAYQWYVKDWRSSRATQRMSFTERGVYREMLDQQWEDMTLPDDAQAVADLIAMTEAQVAEVFAAWPVVRRKFATVEGEPGRIVNLRLERIRTALKRFVKGAKKGGKTRAAQAARDARGAFQATSSRSSSRAPADHPGDSPGESQATSSTATAIATAIATANEESAIADEVLDRARAFIERYPQIYAQERAGARYPVKEARDFPTFLTLVQTWTDDDRLDGMFRVFLHLKGRDVLNQPGSPGQFLHHAPECDQLLRANGR